MNLAKPISYHLISGMSGVQRGWCRNVPVTSTMLKNHRLKKTRKHCMLSRVAVPELRENICCRDNINATPTNSCMKVAWLLTYTHNHSVLRGNVRPTSLHLDILPIPTSPSFNQTIQFHTLNQSFENRRELHTSLVQHNVKETETAKNPGICPDKASMRENVWTVPNALTISRIALTPILGYMVLEQHYALACGMFAYAGITDLLDGVIARKYPSQASMFGSYLDPLADKFLVSMLYVTLTAVGLIPVPLTALVIARDVSLIAAAFYVRYISLTPPRSLSQYFDVTHATAQLHPTLISKVNTAVQLVLVGATLVAPVAGFVNHIVLQALWYVTAGTTFASGITYLFAKDTFRLLEEAKHSRDKTIKDKTRDKTRDQSQRG